MVIQRYVFFYQREKIIHFFILNTKNTLHQPLRFEHFRRKKIKNTDENRDLFAKNT